MAAFIPPLTKWAFPRLPFVKSSGDQLDEYPDINVFRQDMSNYIDLETIEAEVQQGDWQALYNYFASEQYWASNYAIL